MKILKGKHNSATQGLIDAVFIELDSGAQMGIANLGGTLHYFYNRSEFVNPTELVEAKSAIFPKVTDHFSQELLEMTIKFKG